MKGNADILKFIKENTVLAIGIAFAIAALIAYMVIFAPMAKTIRTRYVECRTCENEVLETRSAIESSKLLDKEYGGRTLISEKEAATGIDELAKYGKSLGINFVSIKPMDVSFKEGSQYKILPINMKIEASDEQFVKFMASLDELKKAIIKIRSFDIVPAKEADRQFLKIDMVLEVYLSARAEA